MMESKGRNVAVRKGTKRDSSGFLRLIVALADFEHLDPPNAAARRRILTDIFLKKRARLFVATAVTGTDGRKDKSSNNDKKIMSRRRKKEIVGYALYFFTYSTFLGKPTLYLEDIFVLEEFRSMGIGRSLFLKCVDEAVKQGCGRMELAVLTWNRNAIRFYEKLGASRLKEWYNFRLTSNTLESLHRSHVIPGSAQPR